MSAIGSARYPHVFDPTARQRSPGVAPLVVKSDRSVKILQRKPGPLGKTPGPHHRLDAPHVADPLRCADGGWRRIPEDR